MEAFESDCLLFTVNWRAPAPRVYNLVFVSPENVFKANPKATGINSKKRGNDRKTTKRDNIVGILNYKYN